MYTRKGIDSAKQGINWLGDQVSQGLNGLGSRINDISDFLKGLNILGGN